MRPARVLALAVLASAFLACPSVRADDQKAVDALNAPAKVIQEKSKSWKTLFDAYVAMTAPPAKVGKDFNALTVWPGMTDWSKVKEWAAANGAMANETMMSWSASLEMNSTWSMRALYSVESNVSVSGRSCASEAEFCYAQQP